MLESIKTGMTGINAYYKEEEARKTALKERGANIEEIVAQNKASQIKEAIENDSYKLDLQKTSEKMALNLLNS